MATRFVKNQRGIDDLASSAGLALAQRAIGEAVLNRVRGEGREYGGYTERLAILDVRRDADGTTISFGTTWKIGHIIEFGSRNNPAYAPLRRAITGLGLKYVSA